MDNPNPPLSLELAARLHVTLDPAWALGQVPAGGRHVIPITGGTMDGPLLRGEVVPGGADWFLWRGETSVISARYLLRTHDGVLLGIRNEGVIDPKEALPCTLTAASIEAPVDSPYAWLNSTPLVGTLVTGQEGEAEEGEAEEAEALQAVHIELWRVRIEPISAE